MPGTVLVADDSPTIQNKAKAILKGEGFEVVTVSNGVAAIKKLPTVKPQVILADVVMPGKDGYEVCDFVKKSPELRNVPVLLIFSEGDPYEEQRGAQVQADGRIQKPFDPHELIDAVKKFMVQVQAAAAKPVPTVAASPPPTFVNEPVDVEPELAPKVESPDLSAFSGGMAFGDPMPEEAPTPARDVPAAPAMATPVPEPEVTAPPESALPALEEQVLPAPAETTPPPAEPVLIEEQAAPSAEATMMFRMPSGIGQQGSSHPETSAEYSKPREAERTMMFRVPTDIAQPVFTDEVAPAPPLPEIPAQEPPPVTEEASIPPVSATTLESFSLTDAASGQVRFASTDAEVAQEAPSESAPAPSPQIEEPPQADAAHETPAAPAASEASEMAASGPSPAMEEPAVEAPPLDANFVYSIVQKVVVKMSPPALSQEQIHDLAMKLTSDIIVELNRESGSAQ